ncbi:MAG: hypothetical protein QGG96_00040, partial [Candidatus Poseidoniaceae archaeon]|nr:hypothetical protein [Candidatus Poseidoniaceae archaeon]
DGEGGVGETVKWNSAPDPAIDLAAAAVAEDLDLESPVQEAPAMDAPMEVESTEEAPAVNVEAASEDEAETPTE